ncbi:MAG TPA: TetR/AcrR family transcriptional regulator [Streptosporangiaceae bacterium]|jgi:AcrR family transcriptional regulator|nr:TetR/AcrR family transcriptional regulator [Streptosporangiaceae bacterium]
MSTPTDPPPGLRERKKIKLRRLIQTESLRLFETQGYEHTTVEQIAEAAETSTTTFYRYFPTKEDVVLDNDASPLFEATVATRPAGEPLAATIRAAMAAVVGAAEADRDHTLARMRLIETVPALEARYAGQERRTIDYLARLLAGRTARPPDDYQIELVAFVLAGVLFTASRRWVADQGATPMTGLVDQALTTIEPLLTALERPTGTLGGLRLPS